MPPLTHEKGALKSLTIPKRAPHSCSLLFAEIDKAGGGVFVANVLTGLAVDPTIAAQECEVPVKAVKDCVSGAIAHRLGPLCVVFAGLKIVVKKPLVHDHVFDR